MGIFGVESQIAMEFEPDINSLRDEAFRKIGRNVFNFQKIEHLLKILITNTQTSGWAHNLQDRQIKRRDKIARKTLGTLAGEFFSNTVKNNDETDESQDAAVSEPTISISLRLDTEFHESKRNEIESLVKERNHLIHHRLCCINAETIKDWQDLIEYLDSQRERQRTAYDFLKLLASEIQEFIQFMGSQEGQKSLELSWLAQTPVVQLLIDYALELQDNDGWADLSAAGNKIRQELPGDLEKLKNGWGFKKLPDVLKAFDFFELKRVPLANDGFRWIYRVIENSQQALN